MRNRGAGQPKNKLKLFNSTTLQSLMLNVVVESMKVWKDTEKRK